MSFQKSIEARMVTSGVAGSDPAQPPESKGSSKVWGRVRHAYQMAPHFGASIDSEILQSDSWSSPDQSHSDQSVSQGPGHASPRGKARLQGDHIVPEHPNSAPQFEPPNPTPSYRSILGRVAGVDQGSGFIRDESPRPGNESSPSFPQGGNASNLELSLGHLATRHTQGLVSDSRRSGSHLSRSPRGSQVVPSPDSNCSSPLPPGPTWSVAVPTQHLRPSISLPSITSGPSRLSMQTVPEEPGPIEEPLMSAMHIDEMHDIAGASSHIKKALVAEVSPGLHGAVPAPAEARRESFGTDSGRNAFANASDITYSRSPSSSGRTQGSFGVDTGLSMRRLFRKKTSQDRATLGSHPSLNSTMSAQLPPAFRASLPGESDPWAMPSRAQSMAVRFSRNLRLARQGAASSSLNLDSGQEQPTATNNSRQQPTATDNRLQPTATDNSRQPTGDLAAQGGDALPTSLRTVGRRLPRRGYSSLGQLMPDAVSTSLGTHQRGSSTQQYLGMMDDELPVKFLNYSSKSSMAARSPRGQATPAHLSDNFDLATRNSTARGFSMPGSPRISRMQACSLNNSSALSKLDQGMCQHVSNLDQGMCQPASNLDQGLVQAAPWRTSSHASPRLTSPPSEVSLDPPQDLMIDVQALDPGNRRPNRTARTSHRPRTPVLPLPDGRWQTKAARTDQRPRTHILAGMPTRTLPELPGTHTRHAHARTARATRNSRRMSKLSDITQDKEYKELFLELPNSAHAPVRGARTARAARNARRISQLTDITQVKDYKDFLELPNSAHAPATGARTARGTRNARRMSQLTDITQVRDYKYFLELPNSARAPTPTVARLEGRGLAHQGRGEPTEPTLGSLAYFGSKAQLLRTLSTKLLDQSPGHSLPRIYTSLASKLSAQSSALSVSRKHISMSFQKSIEARMVTSGVAGSDPAQPPESKGSSKVWGRVRHAYQMAPHFGASIDSEILQSDSWSSPDQSHSDQSVSQGPGHASPRGKARLQGDHIVPEHPNSAPQFEPPNPTPSYRSILGRVAGVDQGSGFIRDESPRPGNESSPSFPQGGNASNLELSLGHLATRHTQGLVSDSRRSGSHLSRSPRGSQVVPSPDSNCSSPLPPGPTWSVAVPTQHLRPSISLPSITSGPSRLSMQTVPEEPGPIEEPLMSAMHIDEMHDIAGASSHIKKALVAEVSPGLHGAVPAPAEARRESFGTDSGRNAFANASDITYSRSPSSSGRTQGSFGVDTGLSMRRLFRKKTSQDRATLGSHPSLNSTMSAQLPPAFRAFLPGESDPWAMPSRAQSMAVRFSRNLRLARQGAASSSLNLDSGQQQPTATNNSRQQPTATDNRLQPTATDNSRQPTGDLAAQGGDALPTSLRTVGRRLPRRGYSSLGQLMPDAVSTSLGTHQRGSSTQQYLGMMDDELPVQFLNYSPKSSMAARSPRGQATPAHLSDNFDLATRNSTARGFSMPGSPRISRMQACSLNNSSALSKLDQGMCQHVSNLDQGMCQPASNLDQGLVQAAPWRTSSHASPRLTSPPSEVSLDPPQDLMIDVQALDPGNRRPNRTARTSHRPRTPVLPLPDGRWQTKAARTDQRPRTHILAGMPTRTLPELPGTHTRHAHARTARATRNSRRMSKLSDITQDKEYKELFLELPNSAHAPVRGARTARAARNARRISQLTDITQVKDYKDFLELPNSAHAPATGARTARGTRNARRMSQLTDITQVRDYKYFLELPNSARAPTPVGWVSRRTSSRDSSLVTKACSSVVHLTVSATELMQDLQAARLSLSAMATQMEILVQKKRLQQNLKQEIKAGQSSRKMHPFQADLSHTGMHPFQAR
eukprot:gene25917-11593_t